MPRISVITPSYNQAEFIGKTIESVALQDMGEAIEHIVVDGDSTDGTLDILRKYEGQISWSSGTDRGQADAVNKGIASSKGDIIGWLNSDDLYLPGALKSVLDYFDTHPDCMWLCGKCKIIDAEGKEIWKPITGYKNLMMKNFSYRRLMVENFISQPAVFFRKSFFKETGTLNLNLKYTMDYDLWCRFGKRYPAAFLPQYLASFRRHGASKSETDFKKQFREEYTVASSYKPGRYLLLLHRINIFKIILSYRVINLFR
jgi:glycosyltransferase involved in cell wall biosynthesis